MGDASTARKPWRKTAIAFRFVGVRSGELRGRAIAADGPEGRECGGFYRKPGVNAPGQATTYQAELWPPARPAPDADGEVSRIPGPGYVTTDEVEKAVRAEYRPAGPWWR